MHIIAYFYGIAWIIAASMIYCTLVIRYRNHDWTKVALFTGFLILGVLPSLMVSGWAIGQFPIHPVLRIVLVVIWGSPIVVFKFLYWHPDI